jgi:uncharacterized protein YidB (DUF937 family)
MAFIHFLIQETTEKFQLEKQSIAVISALVAKMNQESTGRLEGFLNRFRQAGMTAHVTAWLHNESIPPLAPEQLGAALEVSTLQQIATKAGLPLSQTTEVIAFLIPLLIGHLAARHAVFAAQPDEIRQALWSGQPTIPLAIPPAPDQPHWLNQLATNTKSKGMKLLRTLPFL